MSPSTQPVGIIFVLLQSKTSQDPSQQVLGPNPDSCAAKVIGINKGSVAIAHTTDLTFTLA